MCADSYMVVGTYIGSVVENNHIIILTLKADKTCLSAKCYSDESGAKLITVLRHLLLDAGKFICLIKSATCASVVSSCSRWLPKEFLDIEADILFYWEQLSWSLSLSILYMLRWSCQEKGSWQNWPKDKEIYNWFIVVQAD